MIIIQDKKYWTKVYLFLLFIIILVGSSYSVPPATQINTIIGQPSITIVYPKITIFEKDQEVIFPFDVLNSTYFKLTNTTTDCIYDVVNNEGSLLFYGDLVYNNTLNYWHFNLNSSDTSKKGTYNYYVYCNNSLEAGFISESFDINSSGRIVSISDSIIYSILLIVCLLFLALSIFLAYSIKGDNELDLGGGVMHVNINKYLKMGLWFISYLFLIFVSFFAWQIADRFLVLDFMVTIFRFIFITLEILLAPIFIAFVVIALIRWTLDLKLWKLYKRGLKPR